MLEFQGHVILHLKVQLASLYYVWNIKAFYLAFGVSFQFCTRARLLIFQENQDFCADSYQI